VDLDAGHDKIADSVGDNMTGVINTGAMCSSAVFGQDTEDTLGKLRCGRGLTEESVDILGLGYSRRGQGTKTEVEWEAKGAADGRNAANDVSAINGAAIPSIRSSVGSFNKNGVGTTVVCCNHDCFIEESMKFFNTNSFVVAFCGDVNRDAKERADGFERAFKGASVVDNDEATEADFKKNFLHEKTS
jgi:hypothetical protein